MNQINSNNFFPSQKLSFELINKFSTLNSEKIDSREELLKLFNLSKEIHLNTYHTKIIYFNDDNIIDNYYLKISNTPYEFNFSNSKKNEIEINLSIPKNKISNGHNFTPFAFIQLKENKIYTNELKKENEDDNFIYFKNKNFFDYDNQSSFHVKGILYDYYFV